MEGWTRGRENPMVPTGTIATLRVVNRGANGRLKRLQKRPRGAGLQDPRGTLDSRSRASRKRISGTGGGGRMEWVMSSWIFEPILEERGRVGETER